MTETEKDPETIRQSVRDRYGGFARSSGGGCCGTTDSSGGCSSPGTQGSDCCGEGYSTGDLATLPDGANLGLGCGNPTRLGRLRLGEHVLDVGSGAGVDCFLAAKQVGPSGHVIGVDMTPDMVSRARSLAKSSGQSNVEFRLGEIEHLPVADSTVDIVLSNCVINLAPEKGPVYREAFRVLRPGGRLAIADVFATRPIPEELRRDPEAWGSCSSGALTRGEVTDLLRSAGFESIEVTSFAEASVASSRRTQAELGVVPGEVRAVKPLRMAPRPLRRSPSSFASGTPVVL